MEPNFHLLRVLGVLRGHFTARPRLRRPLIAVVIVLSLQAFGQGAEDVAPQDVLRQEVLTAMKRAATYYRTHVASHGGYVYFYDMQLDRRWGEGEATKDQIWVQTPGTPTVGMAYLAAYRATRDPFYLEAAREAGAALIYGQLESGGWTNCIDFDPKGTLRARYRGGDGRGKNNSSLDDDQTQSALRFLMQLDQLLEHSDAKVSSSVEIAINALLDAQYPNGAFPQVWTGPVAERPILEASFPEYDWRTEGRMKNYWDGYTLNDGLAGTVTQTLVLAHQIYGDERIREAVVRFGDFLLRAQLPDPQPAWAQQYNFAMHPMWARRFEPPAVTGGESQDVLETLLEIYAFTGDRRYLAPIPRALDYLRRSQLPGDQLARYYELRTNRPLYMRRVGEEYQLTHDDTNLPDHYGWKVRSRLDDIERVYRRAVAGQWPEPTRTAATVSDDQARRLVAALDAQGRWTMPADGQRLVGQPKFPSGTVVLSSQLFSRNLETLSRYVAQ